MTIKETHGHHYVAGSHRGRCPHADRHGAQGHVGQHARDRTRQASGRRGRGAVGLAASDFDDLVLAESQQGGGDGAATSRWTSG